MKILKNNKGQAFFELLIFLPFLMFMYMIYYNIGNAINASIVQQKTVRGYFYSFIKNNSYIVSSVDVAELGNAGVHQVGFNAIGWREKSAGKEKSFGPCFKFSSVLKNNSTEKCDDSNREEEHSSRYIRVFTFYGVCGPYYNSNDPNFSFDQANQSALPGACSLGAN